jgi:hypothetical protein
MDLRSSELEMECISEDHIAAAIDDIIPEIPMDIADLTALTQAATETIVKILVSHNPRLRPPKAFTGAAIRLSQHIVCC